MDYNFYLFAIVITELLMLAMLIHVVTYSAFTKGQKRWYICTFLAVMLCAGAEVLALKFSGSGGGVVVPLSILTAVQFSITPMLPVFFAGALGMRRMIKVSGALLLIHAAIELLSLYFGWVFYFDENGTYFRGKYYIIYEAFYIVSLLFLIGSLIMVGRRFKHRDVLTIVMIPVIMAAGIIPLIFFKIYTDYIAIGVCASLCYIYYNDLVQQDAKAKLVADQKVISGMQENIITGMASLIESRDAETGEHVSRTSNLVKSIAENARNDGVYADALDDRFVTELYALAPMHDVGKIVVPDDILKKPGKLTPEEFEQMKRHASEGGTVIRQILSGITDEEYLKFASAIATCHHERWDGSGYPEGLSGEDIPLAARIMAIADVYDALISERCYKKAIPVGEALEIIRDESGSHFDPKLAEVFLKHVANE
ncbi:MAG: HD domain-containing protein [Clostridia bacterium]|nr:HD domain-containing protein [Clostridia bacterium]